MKYKDYKMKALHVGAATVLLLSTISPSVSNADFSDTTYKVGDRSKDILQVKEILEQLDEVNEFEDNEDELNLFTEELEVIIKSFQEKHGLVINGEIDTELYEFLESQIEKIHEESNIKVDINTDTVQEDKNENDVEEENLENKNTQENEKPTENKNPQKDEGSNEIKNEVVEDKKEEQTQEKKVTNFSSNSTTTTTVLENGMRHDSVKTLKVNLKKLGFAVPGSGTNLFGSQTEKKVKEFQKYYGLTITGKVDKKTNDKINTILKTPLQRGKSHKDTKKLKADLKAIGYPVPGNGTTFYGVDTETVVKKFQKEQKLVVNGIADEVTLKRIEELLKNTKPTEKTEYTNYKLTLSQAVSKQLSDSIPQTDKYANKPAYVSANYIKMNGKAKISSNNVTVYSKPNILYPTDETLNKDESIMILREASDEIKRNNNDWLEVSNNGQIGYIAKSNTKMTQGEVTATVNVRAEKNASSHIYGQLTKGSKVNLKSTTGSWYEIEYKTWRLPTASDLSSEMNPKNADKFQHLRLDTLAGATANQLNGMLKGKGVLNNQGQAFINGAKQGKVNEAYLISHSLLETGNGTSKLATGIEVGKNKSGKPTVVTSSNRKNLTSIKKVYNMYGIGAVDSNPNNAGAIRAYEEGWTTPKKAIEGGAKWVGQQYIHNAYKQNTLYKMRWNPRMAEGYAWKQYATDIGWARKQISRIKEVYSFIDRPNYHYDIAEYK